MTTTLAGLDPADLRAYVVRPTLQRLGLWSAGAEDLVMGTAKVESKLRKLDQAGRFGETDYGPAAGLFQTEKATHDWLVGDALAGRPQLRSALAGLVAAWPDGWHQLATNLAYAAAVCRIRYYVAPSLIPAPGDVAAAAATWKRDYNTVRGAGAAEDYVAAWAAQPG